MLVMNWVTVAFWTTAIPVTHVMLPIVYFVYSLFLHILIIPAFQVLKVLNYTFIYLPFKPVFYWMEIGDPSVTTLVETFPHFQFFIVNLTHYLMVSTFFGILVGIMTGLYLKAVQSMLTIEDIEKRVPLKSVTVPIKSQLNEKAPYVEEYLRKLDQEAAIKLKPTSSSASKVMDNRLTFQNIVDNIASSVRGARVSEITLGQEMTYEDDDGYNYSTMLSSPRASVSEPSQEMRSERALRRASIGKEPAIKEEDEEEQEDIRDVDYFGEPVEEAGSKSPSSIPKSDKSSDDDVFSMRKRKVLDSTNESHGKT